MATINPTIANGLAKITARNAGYYFIPYYTANGEVKIGRASFTAGNTQSGMNLIAGDSWADITGQLAALGYAGVAPKEPGA